MKHTITLEGERLIQVRAAVCARIMAMDRLSRETKDLRVKAMWRRMQRICQDVHDQLTKSL